jgi:predicted house-cleaning noncanonical NTP pyrophosphatase (MazG superfamily)
MPKLVGDKIPEMIRTRGEEVRTHVLDEAELSLELRRKLREETEEFLGPGSLEELADVLEVVYALAQTQGLSREELETIRLNKRQERGGFEKRILPLD